MREKLKSTGTEEFLKELSARIKTIRKARHLRQIDVADFLGVTERHYRLCESGKVDWPSSKLKALTQLFGVSFGELLHDKLDFLDNIQSLTDLSKKRLVSADE